jgi:hypothetical protein
MRDLFSDLLSPDDDPEFWLDALDYIFAEVDKRLGVTVEVGRCSHWLRRN